MNLDLGNLSDLGLSEAQIDSMFKQRGINLSQKELRSSMSVKSLKNKEEIDVSYFKLARDEASKLFKDLQNAEKVGDLQTAATIMLGILKKEDISKKDRKTVLIQLMMNLMNQGKHTVIKDYVKGHSHEFLDDESLEGKCFLYAFLLFEDYVTFDDLIQGKSSNGGILVGVF